MCRLSFSFADSDFRGRFHPLRKMHVSSSILLSFIIPHANVQL